MKKTQNNACIQLYNTKQYMYTIVNNTRQYTCIQLLTKQYMYTIVNNTKQYMYTTVKTEGNKCINCEHKQYMYTIVNKTGQYHACYEAVGITVDALKLN